MSGAAPLTPLGPPPAGLSPGDWGWSLGVHAGVVLAAVGWAVAAGPMPEFRPLPVTLSWQVGALVPPRPVAEVAARPKPEPVVETRAAVIPAAPPPKATRARARVADGAAALAAPMAAPVLQSAPEVVVPVVQGEPAGASAAPAVSAVVAAPPSATVPARAANVVAASAAGVRPAVASAHGDEAYQRWRDHLMQALHQHKRYPSSARRMGQTGTVMVQVRLSAAGELLAWELAESSGFKALDSAAEQLVRTVVQALASQLTPGRATELRIPVVYELTES